MGHQPFAVAQSHIDFLREKGVFPYSLQAMRTENVSLLFRRLLAQHRNTAIFWGIDMDVLQMADAPGVSAPNPVGMSAEELCQIVILAGQDVRTRILEFTEVNPAYDIDNRTSRLVAVAIWEFLNQRAKNRNF